MPYPESCPECGSTFRNTGTHFTARRNEVGRHVLLELGCQNTTGRFWWDFTTGQMTEDGRPTTGRPAPLAETLSNGSFPVETNGHATLSTLELPKELDASADVEEPTPVAESEPELQPKPEQEQANEEQELPIVALLGPTEGASVSFKDAFVRQLHLDRLTLRQMRSWLMSEEARRAIEVAAGATEATYERLALILFGTDLPQLLGKASAAPQNTSMSAEDRLELQREKARIRARVRRAAARAARQTD